MATIDYAKQYSGVIDEKFKEQYNQMNSKGKELIKELKSIK